MSCTWVRIGTNHSKIKSWAVHGWEEVRTKKMSLTWVRTHPRPTRILHLQAYSCKYSQGHFKCHFKMRRNVFLSLFSSLFFDKLSMTNKSSRKWQQWSFKLIASHHFGQGQVIPLVPEKNLLWNCDSLGYQITNLIVNPFFNFFQALFGNIFDMIS